MIRPARPAVFLDRDGTLIHDAGYLGDPAAVRVLPGVPDALRRLERAGIARIVVTNQSGIARGYFTEADFAAVEAEVRRQLAQSDASVTRTYHCPHLPESGCACRKPGVALHRQAVQDHHLDARASWCVGDRLGDVLAAAALGARAALVLTGEGEAHAEAARTRGIPVVPDLAAAVELVLHAASGAD